MLMRTEGEHIADGPRVPARMFAALDAVADEVARRNSTVPRLAELFRSAFRNTLATTVRPQADGTVHVITGDIPAMWLRDSAAQVRPYLVLAGTDPDFADLLVGVVRRQWAQIRHDPYANAFNETANGATWDPSDITLMTPQVWERKYELDSLCYPVLLASDVLAVTGRADHLGEDFVAAAELILATWDAEVDHDRDSPYRFYRPAEGVLARNGLGTPTAPTGLLWSGFRPSDDACQMHFLVPANAMAVVAARRLAAMLRGTREDLANRALTHAERISAALAEHAVVEHPDFGRVYAYEVDGLGGAVLMDDANVPSLLSLPYFGWCAPDDPLYLATRRFVLSPANPYYYSGKHAAGVGSPHNGDGPYVWPIALAIQGLTAITAEEREHILAILATSDAGTGLMHEEFHVDDPYDYTRPWFGWANALFAELCLLQAGLPVRGDNP